MNAINNVKESSSEKTSEKYERDVPTISEVVPTIKSEVGVNVVMPADTLASELVVPAAALDSNAVY